MFKSFFEKTTETMINCAIIQIDGIHSLLVFIITIAIAIGILLLIGASQQ